MGSLSLLQVIFPTQGSNPGVLHCRRILYQLSHKGSPVPLCVRYVTSAVSDSVWPYGLQPARLLCSWDPKSTVSLTSQRHPEKLPEVTNTSRGPARGAGTLIPSAQRLVWAAKQALGKAALGDGDLSLPLGLALGSPIFPSGCEGKLGVALESLQGLRDLT